MSCKLRVFIPGGAIGFGLLLALSVGWGLGLATSAQAVDLKWTGSIDAEWANINNWSSTQVPTSSDNATFPSPIPSSGATITLPSSASVNNITFNDSYTLSGGDLTFGGTFTVASAYTATISTTLVGAGNLTKAGAGTLILSGNNTYTGTTTVSAGVLQIAHANALGTTGAGTTVANGARLELAGGITVLDEALTISGPGINNMGALQSVSGTNTWAGSILLGMNDTRIGANGSGQVLIVSGVIDDGINTFNLVVRNADGGGETILSGQNTYGGSTSILVGTLKIAGGNDRLPTGSTLQIGNTSNIASASFDLNGFNQQVAGLASQGTSMSMTVTNSSTTASTLTINNSTGLTYSGVISGNLNLVKQGTGQQTLSGSAANTYTGTTTVSQGRLHLNKSSSGVVAVNGDLTISGGCVTFGNNAQIADTATVTMSGSSSALNGTGPNVGHRENQVETIAKLIITGGAFTTGSGSTWIISGQGSFTGGAGNTVFVGSSGSQISFKSLDITAMNATAGGTVGTSNSFTLYGNSTSQRSTLTVGSGGLTLNGSVLNLRRGGSGALGSRLVLDGNVTTTGSSASSIKEDTAGGTTGQIGVELSSTSGTVNRTFNIGGGGADLTISIPISNGAATTAGITKTGAGTLTLSAANTYTGTTTVSGGVLRVTHANALGSTAAGTTVADGARLELAGGITVLDEALTISGPGINNMGALQSVSGTNTWAGSILLGMNDTRIGANGSGQVLIVSGVIDDGINTFNLVVRNADGGGETILSGQNTYGGSTSVVVGTLKIAGANDRLPTGSTLQIGNPSNTASASFDLNGFNQQVAGLASQGTSMSMTVTNSSTTASTLTINNTSNLTYSGVISGNLSLVKQGTGQQTLSGSSANTYTGTTTVSQGRLHLNKSTSGVVAVSGDLVISGGCVTFGNNEQIANTATVTMSGSSSALNGTGPQLGYRDNQVETIAKLIVTGGAFNAGMGSSWTISGQGSFTGGTGNTAFVGHSGVEISFGSLDITGMSVTAGNNVGASNSFTLYGNSTTRRSVLTVGSGGLTLNGSVLNLCLGDTTGALGSRVVLNGDVTTTGTAPSSIVKDAARGSIGQIGVELSGTAGTVNRTFNIGGGGADLTISIPISNGAATTAGITKTGPGTLTLSSANTYTGGTTVQAGRLLVNNTTGSGTGTGDVVVQGGMLGGNGTIGGAVHVQSGGTLSAGNSPGHLTIQGNYTQNDGGTLLVELAGYTQGGTQALSGQWTTNGYDSVSVGGSAVLDGYVNIALLAGFQPATGDVFKVLTAAGGITDQGLDLVWQSGSLLPAQYWTYQILGSPGSEQILQLQVGVPEPASLSLMSLGVLFVGGAGVWASRRRRNR